MAAREHAPAQTVNPAIVDLLRRNGLCGAGENPQGEALAGGVSSDIWRIDLASGPVCVKRALPRLRVSQLWEAPVSRNRYEYEWFRVAGEAMPGAVPRVLFREGDCFVMDYLDPAAHPVWKELLRQGRADPAFAAQVGRTLAAIHTATAGREDVAQRFPTDDIFHAIRLEPYLVATASKHADLTDALLTLVERTAKARACLVHGDVSPKNILCGPRGPVFLDAECAWYGDPAFDLAFCLNHLLLKCVWLPRARAALLECFDALCGSYLANVSFDSVERRTAALLPALLLARVDGKSPVEYLTEEWQKQTVRRVARPLIASPVERLRDVKKAWQESST
jgi:aminoglycoside phosphotransferase (APT) family kinase protein